MVGRAAGKRRKSGRFDSPGPAVPCLAPVGIPRPIGERTPAVKYIIEDRYASIYSQVLPGYRDGPSCPVTFNKRLQVSKWWNRTGGYMARVIRTGCDGRRYYAVMERPGPSDTVDVLEAGQRCNYCPAVLG